MDHMNQEPADFSAALTLLREARAEITRLRGPGDRIEWCKAKEFGCECGRPDTAPCPLPHPATQRTVAPHVDGRDFYELCQYYRHSKEIMPPGLPNTVQAFNDLKEYIKTGKLPWPSYESPSPATPSPISTEEKA